MAVHFIDTDTGEISEAPVSRKQARGAAPKAERPQFPVRRVVVPLLWTGALLLSLFVGFTAGALGNSLYVKDLTGQIAVLEAELGK